MVNRLIFFFLISFHFKRRAGGFHYLRYDAYGVYVIKGLAIADYGFPLKCLAYESLQIVKGSGDNASLQPLIGVVA